MWTFVGFFKAPLLCLLCLIKMNSAQLSAPEVVGALSGGPVTITCKYDLKFRDKTKYWCKGPVFNLCAIVVETPNGRSSDRSSITDDKNAGVITVRINSFSKRDEGMYWCVISKSGRDIHTGVRLVSPTVQMFTTPASSPVENYQISWWATLRWFLFILMLCCLVSTHIIVWKINSASQISQQQQLQHQISNIYG